MKDMSELMATPSKRFPPPINSQEGLEEAKSEWEKHRQSKHNGNVGIGCHRCVNYDTRIRLYNSFTKKYE